MSPLGVAHLTALELPPPVFVREAAKAGFASVGFRIAPAAPGAIEYPLRKSTQAQEELRAILQGEGVSLYDVEFVPLTPEVDVARYAGLLEAAADLGAVSLNVSGDDPDFARLTQSFVAMCELAGGFGMRVDLEFMRWRVSANLHDAVRLVSAAAQPNGAILLDGLHLNRSGGKPAELRDVPAGFIRVAQLCDASPRMPETEAEVIAEAREGRLPPGEGSLPLVEMVQALPSDVAFTVEVPIPAMDAPSRLALNYKAASGADECRTIGASPAGLGMARRTSELLSLAWASAVSLPPFARLGRSVFRPHVGSAGVMIKLSSPSSAGTRVSVTTRTDAGSRITATTAGSSNCPKCGVRSTAIHGSYMRSLQDLPVQSTKAFCDTLAVPQLELPVSDLLELSAGARVTFRMTNSPGRSSFAPTGLCSWRSSAERLALQLGFPQSNDQYPQDRDALPSGAP